MSARRAQHRRQSRAQAHAPAGVALDVCDLCLESQEVDNEAVLRAGTGGVVARGECLSCGGRLWFIERFDGVEFVDGVKLDPAMCSCEADPLVWAYNRGGVRWLKLMIEDES